MDQISQTTPPKWWDQNEASGFVPIEEVAPLADQPRAHIDPDEFESLELSVGSIGVQQPLIVTPRHRAPWAPVEPQYDNTYFVVVSGHRRRNAAIQSKVENLQVVVRHYANELSFRRAASAANKQGMGLTPLEEAHECRVLIGLGATEEQIAQDFGKKGTNGILWVRKRLALLRLAPEIAELLDPTIKRKKRLSVIVAEKVGLVEVPTPKEYAELKNISSIPAELRNADFEAYSDEQKRFWAQQVILEQTKGVPAVSRAKKISNLLTGMESYHHAAGKYAYARKKRNISPGRRMIQISRQLNEIGASLEQEKNWIILLRSLEPEIRNQFICSLSEILPALHDLSDVICSQYPGHREKFSSLLPGTKTSARSTTGNGGTPNFPDKLPASAPESAERTLVPKAKKPTVSKAEMLKWSPRPIISNEEKTEAEARRSNLQRMFPFDTAYYDEHAGRLVFGSIPNPQKFIELWEAGNFKFQQQKTPKPDNLPDISEVECLLGD